ncbi:transcriptional regulator [Mesorhizobium sp. SB112]|uniref:transcriptional regulator n=1 Tax=Mesorhizobium sp. SB112 TaxID=3151853 RepID=UPI00326689A7
MTPAKSEAERTRAQYAALTKHYGAIGPAAILAAVLCATRKTTLKPATLPARKAA